MRVDIIRGRNALASLEDHWNSVFDADPEATFFMSHRWLFGTKDGAGRWSFVLAARKEGSKEYSAFMPLRLNTDFDEDNFFNEYNLSGNYTSDYNGLICRPEDDAEAIPAIASKLTRMNWRRLRLLNLRASEERTALFLKGFPKDTFDQEPVNMVNPDGTDNGVCPSVDLLPDWDQFLTEKVSKNTRQKIRRGLRQVENSDEYRITHVNRETLQRDIGIYERLWAARWGKRKGDKLKVIQDTQRRLLRHAFETRSLFMPLLWHNNRPISVLATFVDPRKKAFNFFAAGRDEDFKGPPTGLILHAFSIRLAITVGFKKYDFLRGDEPYKYSFGSEDTRIASILISTRTGMNLGNKLDDRCHRSVTRLSGEQYREGEFGLARRGFEQVVESEPADTKASYLLGIASLKTGDHETAARQFKNLSRTNTGSVKLQTRLIDAYASSKAHGKAIDVCLGALKMNRSNPHIWSRLGDALLGLDQIATAVSAYSTALQYRPDFPRAQAALSKTLRTNWSLRPEQVERRAARHAPTGARVREFIGNAGGTDAIDAAAAKAGSFDKAVQPGFTGAPALDTALVTLMSSSDTARVTNTLAVR